MTLIESSAHTQLFLLHLSFEAQIVNCALLSSHFHPAVETQEHISLYQSAPLDLVLQIPLVPHLSHCHCIRIRGSMLNSRSSLPRRTSRRRGVSSWIASCSSPVLTNGWPFSFTIISPVSSPPLWRGTNEERHVISLG